jgi:hypothetical protein
MFVIEEEDVVVGERCAISPKRRQNREPRPRYW